MKLVKALIAIAAIGVGSQAFGSVLSLGGDGVEWNLELEPNNDTSSANEYHSNQAGGGYISHSTVDYFSFTTIGGDGTFTVASTNEKVTFTIINQSGETLYRFIAEGGFPEFNTGNGLVKGPLPFKLARGSYYMVITCEEGVGLEYCFQLFLPDESSQSTRDSFSGWNYHAWPWVYNHSDKDWLYYYCGSNGWAVWRHKDKKWYSFDEASKAWVVLPGQQEQVPTTNKAGDQYTVQGAANLEMIWVEPGTFTMGSPVTEADHEETETQHEVTLTKGFYLGKYEVTQAQYEAVMAGNTDGLSATPSYFSGNPNRPVEKVSWDDAQVFFSRLNAAEQAAGRLPVGWEYGLPTEAQWEYACRAGTTTAYSWGDNIASTNANYAYDGWDTGLQRTSDVGQYAANPWGFHDMHGNVAEWCADWYGEYPSGAVTDPEGPAGVSFRVPRGGSWSIVGHLLRSASRHYSSPSGRYFYRGFRASLRFTGQ